MVVQTLSEINSTLRGLFKLHIPPLKARIDNEFLFEVAGTKETMQGKKKVDGFYFGSIVPKTTDIRIYYFPIYTHPTRFEWISSELRKCLKGKSCFHIRQLSANLENEINEMIHKGIEIYKKEELI